MLVSFHLTKVQCAFHVHLISYVWIFHLRLLAKSIVSFLIPSCLKQLFRQFKKRQWQKPCLVRNTLLIFLLLYIIPTPTNHNTIQKGNIFVETKNDPRMVPKPTFSLFFHCESVPYTHKYNQKKITKAQYEMEEASWMGKTNSELFIRELVFISPVSNFLFCKQIALT